MTVQEFREGQRARLIAAIRGSFSQGVDGTAHIEAFAARLLGQLTLDLLMPDFRFEEPDDPNGVRYKGYPHVAYLGFGLAAGLLAPAAACEAFLIGLQALRHRPEGYLGGFIADDIAMLGVADGLAFLGDVDGASTTDLRTWLVSLINHHTSHGEQWSARMRALAGDLLDGRGRLRLRPAPGTDSLALDYALRAIYPQAFLTTPALTDEERRDLLRALLTESVPAVGELGRTATWFAALDHLVDAACASLVPTVSDTVRLLRSVQHALKRWPWKEKARRKGTMPTRWLIDDEYDVQALLWTVLYPVYGADLVDEEYLPSWGNVQPRADLGILKLKLIIEVKIARTPGDFGDIEEQVAGDLGLYFKEITRFDRMVVFVYDDCDAPQPERYDGLRNALNGRDRVEEVIIVRRPSMIPNRRERGADIAMALPGPCAGAAGV